jgi:hypothetical protein
VSILRGSGDASVSLSPWERLPLAVVEVDDALVAADDCSDGRVGLRLRLECQSQAAKAFVGELGGEWFSGFVSRGVLPPPIAGARWGTLSPLAAEGAAGNEAFCAFGHQRTPSNWSDSGPLRPS